MKDLKMYAYGLLAVAIFKNNRAISWSYFSETVYLNH